MRLALSKGLMTRVLIMSAIATSLSACPSNETAQADQRWPYSRFIDAIEDDTLNSISLASDKTQATFEAPDGSGLVTVYLPNDPGLLDLLTENGVDIQVQEP